MKKRIGRFIGNIKEKISDHVEMKLRRLCFGMSRETRIIITVCIVLITTFGSLFVFATAIYQIGKQKGRQDLMIEHIKAPELMYRTNENNKTWSDEKE